MDKPRVKDYRALLRRLASLLVFPDKQLQVIAEISANDQVYPVLKISLKMGSSGKKKALISAGIHGDEPSGVETVCAFLERGEFKRFERDWEITLLPCLNPFGFEYATRKNHEKKDLNRLFKCQPPPREIVPIQQILNRPFDLTLELHEDSDSPGYYLFQRAETDSKRSLGRRILDEVEKTMTLNLNGKIEGMPANRGLIEWASDSDTMKWWPMAVYAASRGSRFCFTLETASGFPMNARVDAHLTAIRTAFDRFPGSN
ncbi:MAG: M14 family metallocarboxypeptidase [Nitrospinales bacterium]